MRIQLKTPAPVQKDGAMPDDTATIELSLRELREVAGVCRGAALAELLPLAREVHGEQRDYQAGEERGGQQAQPGATAAEDLHHPAGVPPGTCNLWASSAPDSTHRSRRPPEHRVKARHERREEHRIIQ
jgi:hypothetical protein